MLALQEISDRLEPQQLLVDYCSTVDGYAEVKEWLQVALAMFPNYQHMLGNMALKISGDAATGRTICFNPMEMPLPDGSTQVRFVGIWYVDRFLRTPQGWRISERVEEKCYMHNMPVMLG